MDMGDGYCHISKCYENNIEVIQSLVKVELQNRKFRFPKRPLAHVKEDQIFIRVRNKL